jgi:hypothetical protein
MLTAAQISWENVLHNSTRIKVRSDITLNICETLFMNNIVSLKLCLRVFTTLTIEWIRLEILFISYS